jgi:PST family polysaccharide transporter
VSLAASRGRAAPGAALGAIALSVSNAQRLGVQLAMLPILARLVGPAEYGLVALAVPFVLFCNMLADAGLSQALARRQSVSVELESTVFWLAGALGVALAAFASLAAWPLGLVLHQPRLPALILALSPILVMSGLTAAANARVIREGRFGVFAGGDFTSTVSAAAVALWAAAHGAGAWSLVAQQLTLWSVKFLWVNLSARPRVRAVFRPREIVDLVRFGLHAIGANLADFVARNVHSVIVGGALGATALGYYAMAYQIVRVPDLVLSGPLYLYVFTAVSRAAAQGAHDRAADLAVSALRLSAAVLAPVFAGLALIAPLAVELVLGPAWRASGPVLANLCAAGFGFSLCLVTGAVLMGLGRSHLQFRLAVLLAALTTALLALAARAGLGPVSLALSAGVVAASLAYLAVLGRDLAIPANRLAAAFGPAAGGAAAMTLALVLLAPRLAGLPDLPRLALQIATGAIVYGATVFALGGARLRDDLRRFSRAHARTS